MNAIPLYDATAPITCTIARDEVPGRIEVLERIRRHVVALDETEHGLVLRVPNRADVEADVRRFAADEKRCCAFWGFEVRAVGDDLALRWDAPPGARHLLDRIARALTGDEPITAIAGLL